LSQTADGNEIRWREWSKEAFDEAARDGKLVLLDLTAVWCHWCHVMDETTYSDAEIAKSINDNFVPVRVDIDRRPDVAERYNRGGFPTTAFLSDRGESIWGATYVPPADMKRIIRSVLEAENSGEVEAALERSRMQYLDLSKALEKKSTADSGFVDALFEDIFATYDVEFGGFGVAPKFPHPEVIDLLNRRYAQDKDKELSDAVQHTLDQILKGLYDPVEWGVYRYSVTRDWTEPHYEKMLDTNAGMLRNLARAHTTLGHQRYRDGAAGIATYLLKVLREPESGGFYGSQDADEEYYKLDAKGRAERRPPSVDKHIYANWNAEAVSALTEAGALLAEREWVDAAKAAWDYSITHLWNEDRGLIEHTDGQEIYFFEDQTALLESLVSVLEIGNDGRLFVLGRKLVEGVEKAFADDEGGYDDIMKSEDAIGELGSPRRSLVANSRWARAMALFGIASHDVDLIQKAWKVVMAFEPKEVESYGLFAADYITAWWALENGPTLVEVHNAKEHDPLRSRLWLAAKKTLSPGIVTVVAADEGLRTGHSENEFAVVCTRSGCSNEIATPAALEEKLRPVHSSQA
jgi:hypothetical protein